MIERAGIKPPPMYALGFQNNNCIPCVKATSPAYWALIRQHFPQQFDRMAKLSRNLSVRLCRIANERRFIDEIPDDQDTTSPIVPSCDFLCHLAEMDLSDLPFSVAESEAPTNWPFGSPQRAACGTIAADPPWTFATWSQAGQGKSASQHYSTMSLEAIKDLPVADLAAPDCLLLLWATQAQIDQALDVMRRWGFTFKSVGTWAKQSRSGANWAFGTGYWLRSAAEFFLIGTRGRPKSQSRSERNLIVAPVREHSRKPDRLRNA